MRFSIHDSLFVSLLVAGLLTGPRVAQAQDVYRPVPGGGAQPITLTLEEAIQIALVGNYTIRANRLEVDNASAQVREAWGQVMPQVSFASSYTRNVKSANPFAGSEAGSLFQSFGFIDWLAYNEQARTDDDPTTAPIPIGEFMDRRLRGMADAGVQMRMDDNPFSVPNQFQNGLTIEQTLFNGSAFAAIQGAERLKDLNRLTVDRQTQVLVDQVRQAFYVALLAEEQSLVAAQSVARTRRTVEDVNKRVVQGTTPKFQRLSAEVSLANLETQHVQIQNQASLAVNNLKYLLGVPIEQPVRLRGELDADDVARYLNISVQDAMANALEHRPDIRQARMAVELRGIDRDIVRAQFYPTVSAFANVNYLGNVPDNRTRVISDPNDPFSFSRRDNGFFSQSYWNPAVNVGVRMTWNIFNGFQTSARIQQRQVAIDRARLDYDQVVQTVRLEVEQAVRNLETARQRISSQEQNVTRAELNYEYAMTRLAEGVATQLEERDASDQLDQSRLNYLQAVHDYLVARSAFETAVGVPMVVPGSLNLTTN
jgi:outer membrane protein TolC